MGFLPKIDANIYWSLEQERLSDQTHYLTTNSPITSSAIVFLSNKRAPSLLALENSAYSATEWRAERAPHPNTIHNSWVEHEQAKKYVREL